MKTSFLSRILPSALLLSLFACQIARGGAYTTAWVESCWHANMYADGEKAEDGEQIRLVLVAKGCDFGGFYSDGSLVDTTNNVLYELARNPTELGYYTDVCPNHEDYYFSTTFNISTAYSGYSAYVFLLDTRTQSGAVGGDVVHAYGCFGSIVLKTSTDSGFIMAPEHPEAESYEPGEPARFVVVDTPTVPLAPSVEVPVPVISGIVVDEANAAVRLSVTNTIAEALYAPVTSSKLADGFPAASLDDAVPGLVDPDAPLVLTVPMKAADAACFYKVVGGLEADFQ